MTSAELFEVCEKHVGKPYWPMGLVCEWEAGETERQWSVSNGNRISHDSAEEMIVGAAVMFLSAVCYGGVEIACPAMGAMCITYQRDMKSSRVTARDFGSLVEMVLYACAEVHRGQT